MLKVKVTTVEHRLLAGKMRGIKIDGKRRVTPQDLEEFVHDKTKEEVKNESLGVFGYSSGWGSPREIEGGE